MAMLFIVKGSRRRAHTHKPVKAGSRKNEPALKKQFKRPAYINRLAIKQNKNFKRFLLKGTDKIEIEWGLLRIAHNLKKIAA